MALRAPSNPSSFSPELQTFIVTKYDPLLAIVEELNERLQASEKDRFRLEKQLTKLEVHVVQLRNILEAKQRIPYKRIDEEELSGTATKALLDTQESLMSAWLFSCQVDTPTSALQVLLEFSPQVTEELDVQLWKREEDMWLSFLEELPAELATAKPESFQLDDLRRAARSALLQLCRGEILIILRNVPGKEEAIFNPTAITLSAILTVAFSEAWSRVENMEPESLGRIAIVLEGHKIGTKLRAGRRKFQITPLN